ncbi:MAG: YegP family protein [Mycobacterium sp.]
MWSPRMVIRWLDRHPRAAAACAVPGKILDLAERHPWAAAAYAVPLTIVGLSAVVAYPLLFLPLLVLAGVAVVLMDIYTDQKRRAEKRPTGTEPRTQVAAVPEKRNLASKFEIREDHAGKFRFQLKAANGEIIAASQGYETKAGADRAIQAVKTTAPNAKVEDLTQAEYS